MRQKFFAMLGILVVAQYHACKTAALHLYQLVDQHITVGADISFITSATQDKRLAECSAIGELRKVQVDTLHIVESYRMRVCVIR